MFFQVTYTDDNGKVQTYIEFSLSREELQRSVLAKCRRPVGLTIEPVNILSVFAGWHLPVNQQEVQIMKNVFVITDPGLDPDDIVNAWLLVNLQKKGFVNVLGAIAHSSFSLSAASAGRAEI